MQHKKLHVNRNKYGEKCGKEFQICIVYKTFVIWGDLRWRTNIGQVKIVISKCMLALYVLKFSTQKDTTPNLIQMYLNGK